MTLISNPAAKVPTITVGLRPFAPPAPGVSPAVTALLVTVCSLPDGTLRLEYRLEGAIGALRVPVAGSPPAGPLWQHTCFEAFVSAPDGENYREYNFSPAGQWAAGAFLHYREIGHSFEEQGIASPHITCVRNERSLSLAAEVPPDLVPSAAILRIGLSAVIERDDGTLDYWAICHPAEKPDFHHAGGWTLRLDTRLKSP